MNILAFSIFAILAVVSLIHFYWALGGLWPGTDPKSLANTVIGVPNMERLPPASVTIVVSVAILAAALWPLMWRGLIDLPLPQFLVWLGMWVLIVVFVGRGIVGFMPFFKKSNSAQPFANLNARYFSPLCLLLGAGFATLMIF